VAPAVRTQLFEPGVTTKKGGWGVGLSLARRIIEDVHHGRLALLALGEGRALRGDAAGGGRSGVSGEGSWLSVVRNRNP
jgi:signal transduction histidine kinase